MNREPTVLRVPWQPCHCRRYPAFHHAMAPRKPSWNGSQSIKAWSSLPASTKQGSVKGTRAACGGQETFLSAGTGGEICPNVHAGPGVFFAQGDGGDAGSFEGLDIIQEFGPGGGRVGNVSLGEQVLVVPPTDHTHIPRHAVVLAILGEDSQRTGCKGIAPCAAVGIKIRGDVFEQTSIDLFIKPPPPQLWKISGGVPPCMTVVNLVLKASFSRMVILMVTLG